MTSMMRCFIFYVRNLKTKFWPLLFLALCMLINQKATAGMPFPNPMPLDYFLWSKEPMVFTGKFTRIVYVDDHSGELVSYTDQRIVGELELMERPEDRSVAGQFMEISDAKVHMVAPSGNEYLRTSGQCEYKKLYVPSKIDQINETDSALYYKSLVGKDVVLFLKGRMTYQRAGERFSTPILLKQYGPNWNDGKPLPAQDLTIVQDAAKKVGFVTPQSKLCNNSQ